MKITASTATRPGRCTCNASLHCWPTCPGAPSVRRASAAGPRPVFQLHPAAPHPRRRPGAGARCTDGHSFDDASVGGCAVGWASRTQQFYDPALSSSSRWAFSTRQGPLRRSASTEPNARRVGGKRLLFTLRRVKLTLVIGRHAASITFRRAIRPHDKRARNWRRRHWPALMPLPIWPDQQPLAGPQHGFRGRLVPNCGRAGSRRSPA